MTQITTQGIIEQINTVTANMADLNLRLANAKAELEQTELAREIKNLEMGLKEYTKVDKELREQGKQILIDSGIKKFEALDGTIIQLNKKPGALVIENEDNIGDEYKKEKTTITIDKKQLKEDIKQGVIIDGVYIKEDYTLAIKHNI